MLAQLCASSPSQHRFAELRRFTKNNLTGINEDYKGTRTQEQSLRALACKTARMRATPDPPPPLPPPPSPSPLMSVLCHSVTSEMFTKLFAFSAHDPIFDLRVHLALQRNYNLACPGKAG